MWAESPLSLEARLTQFGLKLKNPPEVAQKVESPVKDTIAGSSLDPKKDPQHNPLTAWWKEEQDLSGNREFIAKWDVLATFRAEYQWLFAWKPDPNMSIEWTQSTGYIVVIDAQRASLQLTPDTTVAQKEEMIRTLLVQQLIARLWDVIGNPSIYDIGFTDRLNTGYADLMAAKSYLSTLGWTHSQSLTGLIDTTIARMQEVYKGTVQNFWVKNKDQWYDIHMVTARATKLLLWIQIENIKTWEFYTVRGPKMGEQPFASIVDARSLIAADIAKNGNQKQV